MRLLWVLALAACGKHGESGVMDKQAARGVFEEIEVSAPPGISDLTIDDHGVMWAIAERDRTVIEIQLAGKSVNVTRHPLEGIPVGIDTEAITWLDDHHFAIGTEGNVTATASIVFAELRGAQLVATGAHQLTSAELGVELRENHGIEALCGHDGELFAATESVGKLPDGTRYSALARLRGDALTVTKVRLTTAKGKLSALHCAFAPDGTAQVIAIERHYGVSRILRFTVKPHDVEVTPEVVLDLAPILHDALNLEGIVQLPDGRLVAINDNQGAEVRGPTELLVFPKR